MIMVNQSLFLLRDGVIYLVNIGISPIRVVAKHIAKGKVHGLYKLKSTFDDDNGYKVSLYKVVALCKSGAVIVFTPAD